MVKQHLKKEKPGPKKQHSRNFREELFEFLADVKKDIELGAEFERKFKSDIQDEDSAQGLQMLFERSGLDFTAPGHWQFLLVATLNAYGKNWTRITTDWTESQKNQFLRDISDQRSERENNSRLTLCERLHENKPKEYPATPISLRSQLQDILKEKRDRRNDENSTPEDIELLKLFDG